MPMTNGQIVEYDDERDDDLPAYYQSFTTNVAVIRFLLRPAVFVD
jgi:hypothetical protein